MVFSWLSAGNVSKRKKPGASAIRLIRVDDSGFFIVRKSQFAAHYPATDSPIWKGLFGLPLSRQRPRRRARGRQVRPGPPACRFARGFRRRARCANPPRKEPFWTLEPALPVGGEPPKETS